MRVLLVEDHDDLRVLFARVLKLHGFDVTQATNGKEALDHLTSLSPDLVITDLWMPVMDGLELIHRLQSLAPTVRVPIIAITADGSTETERVARLAGATDFIIKPIDIPDLIDRLYGMGEAARRRVK